MVMLLKWLYYSISIINLVSPNEAFLLGCTPWSSFLFFYPWLVLQFAQIGTWSRHDEKVNLLLLFGEHILSMDVKGNLYMWAFKEIERNLTPAGHILLEEKFSPSCIMHPDTYLNKVCLLLFLKFFFILVYK